MANDINPAVIKLTQETLGKYVKKPSLSEKLLKKPPFRFLHDVFAVVIRDTGCFAGLYTDDELISDNIKDRDGKMLFLQKMIDVVRICTNVPLTVKTSKIVAGHEVEKTNELLQLMGKIIEGKLNWQLAVDQVLKGKDFKMVSDKPGEGSKVKEAKAKDTKLNKNVMKAKQQSISKEDKTKRTKGTSKEKTLVTKEKAMKTNNNNNKSEEKVTKKTKEPTKTKLTKTDSQTSNKSLSPSKDEYKLSKETKLMKNEMECQHEENTFNGSNTHSLTAITKDENLESIAPSKSVENEQTSIDLAAERKLTSSAVKSKDSRASAEVQATRNEEIGKSSPNSMSKLTDDSKSEDNSFKAAADKNVDNSMLQSTQLRQNSVDKMETTETRDTKVLKKELDQLPKNEVKRESTFTRDDAKDHENVKASRPKTSLRPPSARPPSARPGAPRRRDRNVEIILQPNDQVKMSGIQVKLETFGDLEDDGENLVIIETVNANGVSVEADIAAAAAEAGRELNTVEQGHLVQQILETQKELTQHKDINQQSKYEKDSLNGGLALKQTTSHHMNNLRDVIQNLTKSVNPLGKLMDFIPEDIDAMQLEFSMWRDTYTQAANQLKREKSLTESATEPMKNQLVQIEANILEYMEMIDGSRVKIFQNNDKILKMLMTTS